LLASTANFDEVCGERLRCSEVLPLGRTEIARPGLSSTMSDSEFAALVDDIAHMAARVEEIDARALARRTAPPGPLKPPADAKENA
jgi:hypothetical protein